MERNEQMYWVHTRGLVITLPPAVTRDISGSISRGENVNPLQFHRLSLIDNDPILKKRLPQSSDGCKYMDRVDLEWRGQLLKEAKDISLMIRTSVLEVTGFADEDFAIILFGSIAKGLCKSKTDEDPSNIDLSVIGNFSEEQKQAIFDSIRPTRDKGRERIGNNIGVFIQTPEKLVNNAYSSVLQFISSCAQPLYDPGGIWHRLEQEALEYSFQKTRRDILRKQTGAKKIRQ